MGESLAQNSRLEDVFESRVARPLSLDVCNLQASLTQVDGIGFKEIAEAGEHD